MTFFKVRYPQKNCPGCTEEHLPKSFIALPTPSSTKTEYVRQQHYLTLAKPLDIEDMVRHFKIILLQLVSFCCHSPTTASLSILLALGCSEAIPAELWSVVYMETKGKPSPNIKTLL